MAKVYVPGQKQNTIAIDLGDGLSISPLSLFPIPITQYRNGRVIGYGTGFLMKPYEEGPGFLVTNYHVLTARHPREPSRLMLGYPDSPDELEFPLMSFENDRVNWRTGSIKDVASKDFVFLEHPDREKGVDLVALRLAAPADALPVYLERLELSDDIRMEAGADAFIVGFPFMGDQKLGNEHNYPIWKRASIASEPDFPVDSLPKIYVDSASRPGMSGSPVFLRSHSEEVFVNQKQYDLYQQLVNGKGDVLEFLSELDTADLKPHRVAKFRFIGVYSGRVGAPAEESLQLGIVWKAEALKALFTVDAFAKHPFPID